MNLVMYMLTGFLLGILSTLAAIMVWYENKNNGNNRGSV